MVYFYSTASGYKYNMVAENLQGPSYLILFHLLRSIKEPNQSMDDYDEWSIPLIYKPPSLPWGT